MSKKIFFNFAGTGGEAADSMPLLEHVTIGDTDYQVPYHQDAVRIYFSGCHHSKVGGKHLGIGYIEPDLDTVAKKIRACFDNDGQLLLDKLKKEFGEAVIIKGAPNEEENGPIEVECFSMSGFSRGAVTTFALARHLDDLGKPMSLLAVEPVPGHSKQNAKKSGSEFFKNHDLSDLKNLTQAEVIVGMYAKKILIPFHNTYFRQMAPRFPNDCKTSIYAIPKFFHNAPNAFIEKCEQNFIKQQGLSNYERPGSNEYVDGVFFIPQKERQNFHTGVDTRTQLLPQMKEKILASVLTEYSLEAHKALLESQSFKRIQALYALQQCKTKNPDLVELILNGNTQRAKAVREFIVEFENINQFFVSIFQKNDDGSPTNPMQEYRNAVNNLLLAFPENPTSEQKSTFQKNVLACVNQIGLPLGERMVLQQYMNHFLEGNVLLHSDLLQYIDESETTLLPPTNLKHDADIILDIKKLDEPGLLAEKLYFMSYNEREVAYDKFSKNLSSIVHNVTELADILRYIPPKDIESALKKTDIKGLFNNIDDLTLFLDKLFTQEQKKSAFQILKTIVADMNPTPTQLGTLVQHLSKSQARTLLKSATLPFDNHLIPLFEQLTLSQLNTYLPVILKKAPSYNANDFIGCEGRHNLHQYLSTKALSNNAKETLEAFYPPASQNRELQSRYKNTMTEMRNETSVLSTTALRI